MPTRIEIRTQATTGEWVRPAGWLPMPEITSADTKIAILYAVYETHKNIFYFTPQTSLGAFSLNVDWGDSSSNVYTSAVLQSHTYDYNTVTGTILQDDYGQNYKQVLVIMTPISGTLQAFTFGASAQFNSEFNFLDFIASWSTASLRFTRGATQMQRMLLKNYTSSSTNYNNFYNFMPKLSSLELGQPFSPTSFAAVFSTSGTSYLEVDDLTVIGNVPMNNTFSNCGLKTLGNITASSATNLSSFCSTSINLQEVGNISTPACTNLGSAFISCMSLIKVGTITSTAVTNINNVFYGCYSLREAVFTNLNLVTTAATAFFQCWALEKLRVPNLKVSFSLLECSLNRDALVQVFNDLGTPASTQIITVTRNPGTVDLTAADILIATSKNWTVTL
jgi:hypothetical protein